MNISRRQFITLMAVGAGAVTARYLWPGNNTENHLLPESPGLLLGGGKYIDTKQADDIQYVVAGTRMDGKAPQLVPVNFFPHGIVIDPNNPFRLMLFEKKGPGACEVDWRSGKMTRTLTPKPGCHFYGHGAFSTDGTLIYATETYLNNQAGTITVRDAKTLSLLGEFPTYGENPHDCHLFANGEKMAITNAGGNYGTDKAPAVTYVEVSSGRLLEKIPLGHPRINSGHLLLTSAMDLVVVSAPRDGLPTSNPGGISMRPAGETLKTINNPEHIVNNMLGESLSVAVHEPSDTIAVTNPDADLITFWNLAKGEFITSLEIEKPRGVTLSLNNSHFVFSFGNEASMMLVSTTNLKPIHNSIMPKMYISGSHIINWDRQTQALNHPALS